MNNIYREILKAKRDRKPVALALVTQTMGPAPRKAGTKMLVYPDGRIVGTIGGGALEDRVIKVAILSLHDHQIKYLRFNLNTEKQPKKASQENLGMICGGDMELYIEPILPEPKLYIIGAGHISQSLAQMAHLVGFEITVIDPDKHYTNRVRFPESIAHQVIVSGFKKAIDTFHFDESSYITIITRSHVGDTESLTACLKKNQPFAYLGMIGSHQKIKAVFAKLAKSGIPRKKLNLVHAPIGLDIGAQTPEEIAISILAELISVKYHKS
jgi:xanthine dehydrogenase accessory factor